MSLNRAIINTPIGNLSISEFDGFITHCQFTKKSISSGNHSAVLENAIFQLEEYFAGQRQNFDLPLSTNGTPFQKTVWRILQSIPYGEKWSYQQLAKSVGNSKASRAVGTANAKNQIGIIIPCHRVILGSGKTGGYAGGAIRKIKLLNLEKNNQLIIF